MAELVDALDLGSSSRKGVGVRVPSLAPKLKKEKKVAPIKQAIRNAEKKSLESISPLRFAFSSEQPNVSLATIIIPCDIINQLFNETIRTQQERIQTIGFSQGNVPIEYIQQNFRSIMIEHLKEFLFKYCVLNLLFHKIRTRKLIVTGDPRLIEIKLEPEQDARFVFECSTFQSMQLHEWRYFPFKAPKRKNYKDLDHQVDNFIDKEKKQLQEWQNDGTRLRDWINFDITVLNQKHQPLIKNFSQNYWYRLDDEDIESPLRLLFWNRKCNEEFYTTNKGLQECFSDQLDTGYIFHIKIIDIIPYTYFCFDQFKHHFRVKTNKDMHKKLIEVFSYRNDISQRLAMVEETLKLLISKHRFIVPNHLILRQQKVILSAIQNNPDYNVYRKQKDFQQRIQQLAERQVKESIFIDQLAYHENIQVSHDDIKGYLNLTKRPRMKEFIYFDLPDTIRGGQEVPLAIEEIKRSCLREKTINYAIYNLTKN